MIIFYDSYKKSLANFVRNSYTTTCTCVLFSSCSDDSWACKNFFVCSLYCLVCMPTSLTFIVQWCISWRRRTKGNNITADKSLYRSDMRIGRGESNTLKYRVVFPFTTQHLKVGSSVHSILLTWLDGAVWSPCYALLDIINCPFFSSSYFIQYVYAVVYHPTVVASSLVLLPVVMFCHFSVFFTVYLLFLPTWMCDVM